MTQLSSHPPHPSARSHPSIRGRRRDAAVAVLGAASLAVGFSAAGVASAQSGGVFTPLGTYDSGDGEGGSEIVAYDPATQRLYVTNGTADAIDIIDVADPASPALVSQVDLTPYGGGVQSVAVGQGEIAAAVKANDDADPGAVVRFTPDGELIEQHEVGNLPDAIAYSPDGSEIVVANEGEPICQAEPNDGELDVDPEGTVSIISTGDGTVSTADFGAFTADDLNASNARVFGPGATAAENLEPEYVTVSPDGSTAYVTLQENNAVAVVDIASATVNAVVGLGYKEHGQPGNGFDASDEDGAEQIDVRNTLGMYQPDAIAAVDVAGSSYLVTANEGDARDYSCYSEEIRVEDVTLAVPPYGEGDTALDALGRLKTTNAFPSTFDADGNLEQIYSYGARSFTIWDAATGAVVFDSGDEFEQRLLGTPAFVDGRSDDKGPEPEALAIGVIGDRTFAFIGLERSGGVMMYDISDPANATFVDYVNTSEYDAEGEPVTDVAPEGMAFISAEQSPTGAPILAVSYEVTGTTGLLEINVEALGIDAGDPAGATDSAAAAASDDAGDAATAGAADDTGESSDTADGDTDLPTAGSTTLPMVLLALLAIGSGAGALRFSRR